MRDRSTRSLVTALVLLGCTPRLPREPVDTRVVGERPRTASDSGIAHADDAARANDGALLRDDDGGAPDAGGELTYVRPDAEGWQRRVIYFVLLDRFRNGAAHNDRAHGDDACNDRRNPHAYQGGDLIGLREHLGYIEELGADAVWITPLYRGVPGMHGNNCGFPGYWADFTAPPAVELDPRFGTADDFDRLLAALHARGMPLMLDMVINHAGYGARLVRQQPGWFRDPATCARDGNPEIDCPLAGLPDFDHRPPEVRAYLTDLHRRWLSRFAVDAVRMDTVKHVEPAVFAEWNAAMRDERPGLYVIGELLDEQRLEPFERYLPAGFDGLFNFPLRRALIESFAHGGSVDVAASRMAETLARFGRRRSARMVNLLDNHDVRRFVEEIPSSVDGADAQRRYQLALAALLTLPGVPQLYYGNELGMYGRDDPDNRRFMPDWAFEPAARDGSYAGFLPEPGRVFAHTQRLLAIRHRLRALQDGSYVELWRQNGAQHNNVWAYLRADAQSQVIVIHNNGLHATAGAIPLAVGAEFADGVVLRDALGEAQIQPVRVEAGIVRVSLPGRSSVILVPERAAERRRVRFEVRSTESEGAVMLLTGNGSALGHWDVRDAVELAAIDCEGDRCRWAAEVVLPVGTRLEYKFVVREPSGAIRWESGNNRPLTVDGSRVETTFRR